jgi:hypothetical protein
MICRLDGHCDCNLSSVLVHLMNFIPTLEDVVLLISKPLDAYSRHIRSLSDLDLDHSHVTVYGFCAEKSSSGFTYRQIAPFLAQFAGWVGIAPTLAAGFPVTRPLEEVAGAQILSLLGRMNESGVRSYAVGAFSVAVMNFMEANRSGESTTGVLLVDRTECCSPLFMHCEQTRLDRAASQNLIAVLRDADVIENYLDGTIDNFFGARGKASGEMAEHWWQDAANKDELSKRNPSLPFLFSEVDADLSGWEQALLEGCSPEDLIDNLDLNPAQKKQLTSFVQCFTGSCIELPDDRGFLRRFSSGVQLEVGGSHTVNEMLMLPQLVRSIVAPQAQLDPRINTASSGATRRGPRATPLRSCSRVYVVVFGGISFLELREIKQICAKGNQQMEVRVISDTICSAVKLL